MTAADSGEELEIVLSLSIKPQHLGVKIPSESHSNCSIEKHANGKSHLVRYSTLKEYVNLVIQYSQRRLQHSSDALRAIAGLSHVLESCFQGAMKQGLPQTLLDAALLWRPAAQLHRRNVLGIASWSWAGWEGPVKYEDAFQVIISDRALKRVAHDYGAEAFRPLLRYLGWRSGRLGSLNHNGLGVPLQFTTEELPEEWDRYPPMLSPRRADDDFGYWDFIIGIIHLTSLSNRSEDRRVCQSKHTEHDSSLPQTSTKILPPFQSSLLNRYL